MLALDTANRIDYAQESYAVTRTDGEAAVACSRTAWTINPLDGVSATTGDVLRFGMKFALTGKAADGSTLYLQSQRYTLTNLNYAGTGGVGAGVSVVTAPSYDTAWKVVALDPSELAQFESVGAPVPANTFICLEHAATCTLLNTEGDKLVKNKYGGEYLVSAMTQTSTGKQAWGKRSSQPVGVGNHFAFTTAEEMA